VKLVGGGGCCRLKEEDARLGRYWATRPGGPKWAIAMAGQKKLEITYGLQRSTGRIEMGRERKNIIVFAIF
jgi:hypothetical protein